MKSKQEQKQFLIDLKHYGEQNDVPNVSFKNIQFLRDIVAISWSKNILELGMANGFSTINFAFELINNGTEWHITTIDFSPKSYEDALNNLKNAWVEPFITPILENVLDRVPKLPDEHFDFIFIDAMKKRSLEYFQMCLPKLKKWGIIIIDDVIKFAYKMPDLLPYFEKNNIPHSLLPIDDDDGILMYVKR